MILKDHSILVVGSRGNMGKRYCSILGNLGVKFHGVDIWPHCDLEYPMDEVTGIIIATPTADHEVNIRSYSHWEVPILCEKPFSKNLVEVEKMIGTKAKVRMINQYEYFTLKQNSKGTSYYDYFKTGTDSLAWDCINIIGLAEEMPVLKNISPIWSCWINGNEIDLRLMDHAYVWNVESWLEGYVENSGYIMSAHEKVVKYLEVNP